MSDTIRSLIIRCAKAYATRIYLIDPDSDLTMTYEQLRSFCQEFGRMMWHAGFTEPTKVGFMLENGHWTTIVCLGTMYSGHVIVPLNVVASRRNLLFALTNAGVEVVFVSERYRPLLDSLLDELDKDIQIVDVDTTTGFQMPVTNPGSDNFRSHRIKSESAAMILHTSGTVGLPKGAVLKHSNLIAGGDNVKKAHWLSLDDIAYCVLPLYHINGLVVTAISPIISGSRVVMPRKFSVSKFCTHIDEYKCTWVSLVPTMAKYILDELRDSKDDARLRAQVASLRFVRSASSSMPSGMHEDFEEIFGVPMIETMGLTETSAPILANRMPLGIRKPGSVGRPCGTEVKIISNEQKTLGNNEIGEIVVRGPNVFSEYFNAPYETLTSFTHDGWFRTGDLGFYDQDNYFFVTGRIKELIIKGGENISPREVDDVLYHHDSVKEAGAFGLPDDTYGQIVAVGVVLKANHTCSEEELIEFCRKELGDFRCPSKIFFTDDLPKGPSGKIQRLEFAKSVTENMDKDTGV
ncbi:MAG: AMP-binding protein [Acidiferrobacterales bacterium]|nr:AMP-binding protein [Acidiferrobacterales bacterium]